ncbi:unnamed protein product [Paramecium primaurelia]|uniref:Tr-type G domain-containing protein n=1 Tax=Paramecium primaurelia TaxID=5886 RepID=A0A8S1NHM4_PARPR|nr:unnamed protein product [Paramecium primaurelia]
MSRHQGVYNMIKHGAYNDDDYEDEDDYNQQEDDEQYGDHNFTRSELEVINNLSDIFQLDFTRKQIIDALYETDGDSDAAFEYLSNKIKKTQKQQQPQKPQATKKQQQLIQAVKKEEQPQQLPQLIKQSNSIDKSKNQFHIEYKVDEYNSPYPSIKYKNVIQTNPSTSIVILGHVDTGKSTLTGKLLQIFKALDDKEIRKNQKEAKNLGKDSSALAYATDMTKEEKEKGVTMDMAYKTIVIGGRQYNLLDSPGHQDFAPHLIAGAAQADYAILVIDTTKNAFENSIKSGMLREKLQLISAMLIKQIIVALNKMDQIDWNQKQFEEAKEYIKVSAAKLGYNQKQIKFIPISAFQGLNIQNKHNIQWYQGDNLVQEILNLPPIQRGDDKPLRFTILNRFHQNDGKLRGTCLLGKLHSGQLEKNINYVILPQGIFCEVKEVERQSVEGDIVEIKVKTLIDSEFQNIQIGSVLSQIEYHVPVANRLVCQISTLDLQTPIIKGSQYLMHLGAQKIGVVIKKLNHIYDQDAQTIKKKFPRAIVSNELAEVELECDGQICVETHTNLEQLSRIILREKFNIVAIGKVTIINVNLNKLKQGKIIHEQQI